MVGIGFIIVGLVLLLQAAGLFAGVPSGLLWGTTFIVVGLLIMFRRSMRSRRRDAWIAQNRGHRNRDKDTQTDKQDASGT